MPEINEAGAGMTPEEVNVWRAISLRHGAEASVSRKVLSAMTSVEDRKLRGVIHNLVVTHGKLICSTYGKGGGYFVPIREEEIDGYAAKLRHHAISILRKEAAIRKLSLHDLLAEYQTELFECTP